MASLKANRKTQQQRILDLLLEGFHQKREITLPEILDLRIALYQTRILELRRAGWRIENRMEMVDGQRHSWYSLKSAFPAQVISESERIQLKQLALARIESLQAPTISRETLPPQKVIRVVSPEHSRSGLYTRKTGKKILRVPADVKAMKI